MFRRQTQLERHAAIHARRRDGRLDPEDKVGNYHLATEATYLPWREAKPVLDTYLTRQKGGQVRPERTYLFFVLYID